MTLAPCSAATLLCLCLSVASAQTTPTPKQDSTTPPGHSALTAISFYEVLLGEMNVRAGEPGAGYSLILDAARKVNDERLYQRAVELALQSRSGEAALQAARAWAQAQPTTRAANRSVLQILLAMNRLQDSLVPLKREIALASPEDRHRVIAAIPRSYLQASDLKLAGAIVEQAMADYTQQPETAAGAWAAIGRMRLANDNLSGAMDAAKRAQAADLKAPAGALLALELMERNEASAEAMVQRHLDAQPSAEARMGYARLLTDQRRFSEALGQLNLLSKEKPNLPETWLLLGTLRLQAHQPVDAQADLKRYVALATDTTNAPDDRPLDRRRGLAQAYLSLAQIAEERKEYADAEAWIARIDNAQDMMGAQSRRASILARQGKLTEARALLRALPEKGEGEARLKVIAEANILKDYKQFQLAYDVLAEFAKNNPDDADVMYEQSTMAEKLGQYDEMERLLRRVIMLKPDYHHAYNALGFSLADRNVRVPEAKQLILKALQAVPADAFIQDSLGWAEFRLGNTREALKILEAAFAARPDAEIAAHLGEVLWTLGERTKALKVWKQGQSIKADNETLVETLQRLKVSP